MAGPENPSQAAIDSYMKAVGKPLDESTPWDPRQAALQRTDIQDKKLVTKPIETEGLENMKNALWDDNLLEGYEEMSVSNQVQRELERLKQTLHPNAATEEEKQRTEYRISRLQTNLRLIVGNRERLQRVVTMQNRLKAANIKVDVDPNIESNFIAHTNALTNVISARVAIAQYLLLTNKKADGKSISDQQLADARSKIPATAQGWDQKQNSQITLFLAADPERKIDAMQDKAFRANAVLRLEDQIDRLLTYDFSRSVPGVSPEANGLNPISVYYVEYLSKAMEAVNKRRQRLAANPSGNAAEDAVLQKLQADISGEFSTFTWQMQREQIGVLDDVSLSFFDTTYAPKGNEGKPAKASPEDLERLSDDRKFFAADVAAIRVRFHQRTLNVMGGTDPNGGRVKGIFDRDLFDLDDWALHAEDANKDLGRFNLVHPVLKLAAHVGVAPRVLRKYLNPLEMDVTFKDEVEKVMKNVRKAWKLPDVITIDGKAVPFDLRNPDHWNALSPEQWAEIEKSRTSTLDLLEKQKQNFNTSLHTIEKDLTVFQALYDVKNPDEMVGQQPDKETFDSLVAGGMPVLDRLILDPELANNPSKLAACYFYLFMEMQNHADAYSNLSASMQNGFTEISESGLDAMKGINEANKEASDWWVYALFGAMGYFIARGTPILGNVVKFGEVRAWRGARWGYNRLRGRPNTPATAVSAEATANELRQRLARETAEKNRLQQELQQANQAKQARGERIATQAEEITMQAEKITQLETDLAESVQREATLQRSVRQMERLQRELSQAQGQVGRLQTELQTITGQANASAENVQKLQTQLTEAQAQYTKISQEFGERSLKYAQTLHELTQVERQKFIFQMDALLREAENIQAMKGGARVQAWHAFFESKVRPFMKEFNKYTTQNPEMRRTLAERVFGGSLSDKTWKALELAHETADQTQKFNILMESIDNFKELPRAEQIAKTTQMKRLMQVGLAGEAPAEEVLGGISRLAAAKRAARVGTTGLSTAARVEATAAKTAAQETGMLSRGLKGLRWTHAVPVAVVAAEAYAVRQDIYQYADALQNEQKIREDLHRVLTAPNAGFTYDAKTDSYKKGGVELKLNAEAFKSLTASKIEAAGQKVKADATVAALGLSTMFMSSGVGIPVGLLIAGGAITVRLAIDATEKTKAMEFIQNSEPWLLAYMGTSITGFAEDSLLYRNWYDFMVPEMPLEVRQKVLFALFMNVMKDDPRLMSSITGGDFTPESLNEFYKTDFKTFVLPTFDIAMFTGENEKLNADKFAGSITFAQALEHTFQPIDSTTAMNSYKSAARKTLEAYNENVNEFRFTLLTRELKSAIAEGRDADAVQYEELLQELGKTRVLGNSLYDASAELLAHDTKVQSESKTAEPETRSQLVLKAFLKKLKANSSKTYDAIVFTEMNGAREKSPLRVTAQDIGWEGKSVPVIRAGYQPILTTGFTNVDDPNVIRQKLGEYRPFFMTDSITGSTGSVADEIDPTWNARIAENISKELLPSERMDRAWDSTNAFVELFDEDGMTVYGLSKDGKEMLLIGRKGADLLYKTAKRGESIPSEWSALDHEGVMKAMEKKSGLPALFSALVTPNEFDDAESIRRIVLLFVDPSKVNAMESAITQLTDVYSAIPSGDFAQRQKFLTALQFECAGYGLIRNKRTVSEFAGKLYQEIEKGTYGELAKAAQKERRE